MSVYHEDYVTLKNDVLNSAEQNLNSEHLRSLVITFQHIINSKRRSSYINSFSDFISILEKRGNLGERNQEPLREIINLLPDSSNWNHLMSHQSTFRNRIGGAYNSHFANTATPFYSFNSNYSTPRTTSSEGTPSGLYSTLPETVVDRVCRDIGTQWKDMARYLDIREGEIDEIEVKYANTLRERARECMKRFLRENDPYKVQAKLIKALEDCGRRDLREDIEEMLSRRS